MLYPDFHELVALSSKRGELDIRSKRNTFAVATGNYASPFRGQGLAFHEVREYRPGDDIRNIDWRVTARVNKPHMKVFTEDRERTVLVCIDANAAMRFGTRGTFKSVQAARVAALLGWFANGSHDRVGCVVFGDVARGLQYFRPVRSRRSLWQTLKLLSEKVTGAHGTPVALETALTYLDRAAPTGSLVFVVSDFYLAADELEQSFGSLQRRCDIVLIRINDPADSVIPPIGIVQFSDDNNGRLKVETDSRIGREAYTKTWQENRRRVDDICRRRGMGLIDLQTAGDINTELLSGLRRLSLGRKK